MTDKVFLKIRLFTYLGMLSEDFIFIFLYYFYFYFFESTCRANNLQLMNGPK